MKAIRQGQFRSHGEPDEVRGEGADETRDGAASDESMAERDADPARTTPSRPALATTLVLTVISNEAPDRVEARQQAIDDQSANEGGDQRARRALGRGGVPQSIKKPGRRRRRDADDIGRDQPEGVAKQRANRTMRPIASGSVGALKTMERGMNSAPPIAGPAPRTGARGRSSGTKKGRPLMARPFAT